MQGVQGLDGKIKAYACANQFEFFAELSTAYLYALDGEAMFNKVGSL